MSTHAASSTTTTTTSKIAQTADTVLNTVGDKVADITGQHETVKKTTAFVEENVLGIDKQDTYSSKEECDVEAVHGFGAAKEHVDSAGDEKIEEFMRHQTRSYQG